MGYEAIRLQRPLAVDDIVSVHYFEYSSNYYFEGERHDFWEFLYVDKGELDVRAGDVVQHLKKGQIIFHKPGEFHALSANGVVAPNLVVVGFVCHGEAMRFFENRVLSVGDTVSIVGKKTGQRRDAVVSALNRFDAEREMFCDANVATPGAGAHVQLLLAGVGKKEVETDDTVVGR